MPQILAGKASAIFVVQILKGIQDTSRVVNRSGGVRGGGGSWGPYVLR